MNPTFTSEYQHRLPDGREVTVRRTLQDVQDEAGQTWPRCTVRRQLIGDITPEETAALARQLGWLN